MSKLQDGRILRPPPSSTNFTALRKNNSDSINDLKNNELETNLELLKESKRKQFSMFMDKSHGNQLICSSCIKNSKSKNTLAKYLNIQGFMTVRYLCEQCYKFFGCPSVIPLDINLIHSDSNLLSSKKFVLNCTINRDYHHLMMNDFNSERIPLDGLVENLFKSQIKNKLQEFTKQLDQFWYKIKNELKIRYNALIGTFERETVKIFLQNIKNPQISQSQKIIMLQSLKYANSYKFDNPQVLHKSIYASFGGISSVIDEQLRAFKLTQKLIQKKIRKYDIGKIYKEQQSLYQKQQRFQNFGYTNPQIVEQDKAHIIDLEEFGAQDSDCIETQKDLSNCNSVNKSVESIHSKNEKLNLSGDNIFRKRGKQLNNSYSQESLIIDIENYSKAWTHRMDTDLKIVKIKFDKLTQTTIKNILMCPSIEQLYFEDPKFCKKQYIISYLKELPKLKVLQLNCRNQFDEECMMIAIDKLQNIQKLHYAYNVLNSIGQICQNSTFRRYERQKLNPRPFISNKILLNLIDTHPQVKNIYIRQLNDSKINVQEAMFNQNGKKILHNTPDNIFNRLYELDNLESISLGKQNPISLTDDIEYELSEDDWQNFSQLKGLKSICLLNVIINDQRFLKILEQNIRTLVSVYLHNCRGFSDTHTMMLKRCFKLRQLYLYRCGQHNIFTGSHIFDISRLKVLAIRQCNTISISAIENKLTNLRELTHLDFYGCQYVNDNCFRDLGHLADIQYFNLEGTIVSTKIPYLITELKCLRALDIGNTRIIVKQIEEICQICINIQKISFRNLNKANMIARGIANPEILWRCGQKLKCLKHLDVVDCQKMTDDLWREFNIQNLQFVNYGFNNFSKEKIKELEKRGIVFVEQTFT